MRFSATQFPNPGSPPLMKKLLRTFANQLPVVGPWFKRQERYRDTVAEWSKFAPPGHFYSPIPSFPSTAAEEERVFSHAGYPDIPGIDMRQESQAALLRSLSGFLLAMPFTASPEGGRRWGYNNSYFGYLDGLIYHALIRHWRPSRVIEIGSGYSSCMLLDTNDICMNSKIKTTFIDPNPERLAGLLRENDSASADIVARRIELVDPRLFDELGPGDILFIDSSHVSKWGSDVNHIFFNVLPRLASGVHVHVHDVFHPFEYPSDWLAGGRAWNEAYLLRAFLMYNNAFQVDLSTDFLVRFEVDLIRRAFPLFDEWRSLRTDPNGASIWLTRL